MGVNVVIILFFYQHWRYDPRQEPDAAIPHVRIRAGGRPRGRFLPRQVVNGTCKRFERGCYRVGIFKTAKQLCVAGANQRP
jgi:hypothetical protein